MSVKSRPATRTPVNEFVDGFLSGKLPHEKLNFAASVEIVYWLLTISLKRPKDVVAKFANYKAKKDQLHTYRPTLTAWLVVESALAIKRDPDITQRDLHDHLRAMYDGEGWKQLWSAAAWERGGGQVVAPDLSLDAARVWAIVMGEQLPTMIARDDDADEKKRSADVVAEEVADEDAGGAG